MANAVTKFPFFSGNTSGTIKTTGSHCGKTLSESLSSDSNGSLSTPHFLRAMVLDQRRVYGNAVPVQLVIDGQQRLTTFQIFLSALRDL